MLLRSQKKSIAMNVTNSQAPPLSNLLCGRIVGLPDPLLYSL
jgi:hypothetical protein